MAALVMKIMTMMVLLPNILANWPFTTPPPYTGAPPGSSSCVVAHTTGTFYMSPGQAKVIVDSTNSTCEGYLCDGNTGTATQELSMSATCTQGCVDVVGSTNYCKCRADCTDPEPAATCATGWTESNSACYKFVDVKKKFADAEAVCAQDMNSTLTPIQSRDERQIVKTLAGKTIWIGGDKRDTTDFQWSDGTPVADGYTSWKSGEPDGAAGTLPDINCMTMSKGGKWMDYTCSKRKKPYVCKYLLA
ncbi:aggrecan core protein-like isoform X1 [Littorina saxatilis]|uniref:C-type lectin domain-containing protein n=2 Tax=Littorina saxatilis TaxID=31220 RepID=A0AAN9BQK6_9CAEN